jgi:hypothetical protein
MGVIEVTVTVIGCDDCDEAFENSWGDRYFEFPTEDAAVAEAKDEGWAIGDDRHPDATCPDCVAKRKRAAEGKPELTPEIPGQLDLLAEVAA